MATEQLYRRCPAGCLRGEISEYEQGPNATHTSWCRACDGSGYVPVDPPNVPAIVAAAKELLGSLHHDGDSMRPRTKKRYIDVLREALASTVAPLTEYELMKIENTLGQAFGPHGLNPQDSVAVVFAKLVELRPELALFLGVGDA